MTNAEALGNLCMFIYAAFAVRVLWNQWRGE